MSFNSSRPDWLLATTVTLCTVFAVLLKFALAAIALAATLLVVAPQVVRVTLTRGAAGQTPPDTLALLVALAGAALVVWLALRFVDTLIALVKSVGTGDPLTLENARRLETLGWLGVAIKAAGLLVGLILAFLPTSGLARFSLDFKLDIDLDGIILILLAFVLARVFRVGAAMRAELEGTV